MVWFWSSGQSGSTWLELISIWFGHWIKGFETRYLTPFEDLHIYIYIYIYIYPNRNPHSKWLWIRTTHPSTTSPSHHPPPASLSRYPLAVRIAPTLYVNSQWWQSLEPSQCSASALCRSCRRFHLAPLWHHLTLNHRHILWTNQHLASYEFNFGI